MSEPVDPGSIAAWVAYLRDIGVRELAVPAGPATAARSGRPDRAPETPPGSPALFTAGAAAPRGDAGAALRSIREEIGECTRCRLHEERQNVVFGVGDPGARLMFVGEGPGADEDARGEPFVGRAGQKLDQMIQAIGLRREQVYIANVVKCRPPGNRDPRPDEVATCSGFLFGQIRAIRPAVIVTLGSPATKLVLNVREGITKLRGRWFDFEGIPVMPTFHPAYLLRAYTRDNRGKVFDDLKQARARLDAAPVSSGEVGRFAAVAVPVPLRRLFTYSVPEAWQDTIGPGSRVRVPFGRRSVAATVVEYPAPPPPDDVEPKPLVPVEHGLRELPADLLGLTRFVAEYYLCSWGEAIEAALPPQPGPRRRIEREIRRAPGLEPSTLPVRAVARRRLVDALPSDGSPTPVAGLDPALRGAIAGAVRAGAVIVEARRTTAVPTLPAPPSGGARLPEPTARQRTVLEALAGDLERPRWTSALLYGATGSGKTEVYFRAAETVLAAGRGVLYLVPEIGLTPLLMSRVRERFGATAVLLHSGLAPRERYEAWCRLRDGSCRMAVGTRSAVFAPVREPGLIVVDEEQDHSYKQDETPRYNGRDLALVRARSAGAVALLGSATPSMESFHSARSGRYRLLRLGGRVHRRPMPEVTIVDMREQFRSHHEVTPLSDTLATRLQACVGRGEQALILRNRRGWSSALFCPSCGERVSCGNCSVSLTWHQRDGKLRCHHCDLAQRRPARCPRCDGDELHLLGEGSEQVESLVRELVPDAVVERMDRDTIRRRGAHESLLRRFERGEIQVIVGTQMIAKGHDFPNVTLVGVLNADQSLGLPDFRAAERVFQLLTQVAGRAGRGERPGEVVVQAFDADHPLLQEAATQDFEAFYDREIRYRRALRYPPLTAVVRLVLRDADPSIARMSAERLAAAVRRHTAGRIVVAGPGPAPVERLRGQWRQQILLRSAGRRRMLAAVERGLADVEGELPRRGLVVDVDPLSLL